MSGTAESNRRARRAGHRGEEGAVAEGLDVHVSHAQNLIDGEVEVKTAQLIVRDQGGLRTGRFRLYKEQHDQLVKEGKPYHFRLDTGDETVPLCEVPARKLKVTKDTTIPWTSLPCVREPSREE